MKTVGWRRWAALLVPIPLLVPVATCTDSTATPALAGSPTPTPELLADLDAMVPAAMITFDVPGAAIALMQDGQFVYAKGFGVRNLTTGQPFTSDTVFR
jgi:CubicO group peptidase (beta-lactamase class C family)